MSSSLKSEARSSDLESKDAGSSLFGVSLLLSSSLKSDAPLFESVVSSFFCSSLLGLIAISTVRPSEVTTSPLELIRTWISDPLARISVPESPAS